MPYLWNPLFSLIPVENMIKSKQQGYYEALQQSGADGESMPFIRYMCETILAEISALETQTDQENSQESDQVKKLRVVTDSWLSTNKIMQLLGLSHKPTFRKNYLEPALKQQFIERQFPDSPRSPKQKYRRRKV